MRFHHMCIVTPDLKEAIHFWRDIMEFDLKFEIEIPDGPAGDPNVMAPPELVEDLYKVKGARSKVGVLMSKEGAIIELLEPQVPAVQRTPREKLLYADSGIRELALVIDDIDAFFLKIRTAGYKTQTEYVWQSGPIGRTFIFYDQDRNMIQMWEHAKDGPRWLRVD